jgi:hypothetical protein
MSDTFIPPNTNRQPRSEDGTTEVGTVLAKDAFGVERMKPPAWFAAQLDIYNQVPNLRKIEGAIDFATDLIWGREGEGTLTRVDTWRIGNRFGIPISMFQSGGGSGSGKSAEQRQYDIQSLAVTISNEAKRLGIALNNDTVAYIATVAEKQGFSQEQVTSTLTGITDWSALQDGDLTNNAEQFKQLGKNYLINVDDKTAQDWATRVANNSMTADTVKSIISQQAKTLNPWLASTIDSGVNPLDMLAASRNKISESLGLNPGEVDFSNSQYLKMVTVDDPKSGMRLANNNELQKNIRTDSRWAKSSEAKQMGSQMAGMLSRIFGRSVF